MGSIDIIKPLATVLSSAVNKSQHHQEKNLGNTENIEPGAAGCEVCQNVFSSDNFAVPLGGFEYMRVPS